MLDFAQIMERGRLWAGLLLVVMLGVVLAAPLGGSESPKRADAQWVAEYRTDEGASASQILDQFATTGVPAADGAAPQTVEAEEGEATSPLPANYVSGSAPSKDLAAVLRQSQQRNSKVMVPTVQNAAMAITLNPNVIFTRQSQIADLRSGKVDPRVVDVMTWIANRGRRITITSMRSDHSTCVAGSNPCRVSAHHLGRAMDIAAVNGEPCRGTPTGQCGRLYEEIVNSLRGTQYQPSQVIYGYDPWPSESWNFEMGNHHDHIHLGF